MSAATWPACFSRFFSALRARGEIIAGAPGSKGEWKAHCPAHDDTVQSLSVARGRNGQLIVRCHSPRRCPVPDIVKALGVKLADLYPDQAEKEARREQREKNSRWRPRKPPTPRAPGEPARVVPPTAPPPPTTPEKTMSTPQQRTPVAFYPYKDEAGNLLYETVRWNPKGFNQRRPNPNFDRTQPPDRNTNPPHLWNVDGVRLVPYKLPELVAALKAKPDRLVLIVEGEKDVEQATAAGLIATTSPMGVGGSQKCWPLLAPFFKGANVVVIPDEDPVTETGSSPGLAHAERIATSLLGVAASVRVARLPGLPPKGDLTDWWHLQENAGESIEGIKAKLRNIVNATPYFQPGQTVTAAAHVPPSPPPPVAPPPPVTTAAPASPPPPVANPAGNTTAPNPGTTPAPAAAVTTATATPIESNPNVKVLHERGIACGNALRGAGVNVRSYAEFVGLLRLGIGRIESALERAGFRAMNDAETSKTVGQEVQVLAGILYLAAADTPHVPQTTPGK